jgi:anhydro-N-acetylmuramic acid kinase
MKFNTGSKTKKVILGVMSGTSCDGLDLALCLFSGEFPKVDFEILSAQCFQYSAEWREKLQNCMHYSALELAEFENQWSRKVAENICEFIHSQEIKPELIGFHGHTIFHQPQNGFTVQMGSGATISRLTGIDTICDFRQQDVALGGQGAPLVPIGEKWLFEEFEGFMNLGGFSNVTRRRKESDGSETMQAYDVCAVNIVLNQLCSKIGLAYDADGKMASQGKISVKLIEALKKIDYHQMEIEGSLGLEWVEAELFPVIHHFAEIENLTIEDQIATYTEFCAITCARAMPSGKYLISGGGTHNAFLLRRIRAHAQSIIEVPENQLNDFKEALIFAFLAGLRAESLTNTLTSVTGASHAGINGAYYKA